MTIWEAFFLGLIQGVTEFLPISSSGHLELAQYFLGFEKLQSYVLFNLICHLGTLGSILYMFLPQIKQSLITERNHIFHVILGTLPLFPLVLILKPIKATFDQPQYLGLCFLFSAVLLFSGVYFRLHMQKKHLLRDCLTIGLFQAVAVLPGISRSGATISAARLLGWDKQDAIQFSFLLAIPAILGGTFLEIWQFLKLPASEIPPIEIGQFLTGFLTSFMIGCASLWAVIQMMTQDKWVYFAWYCLFIGIATTLYFQM
ncbi:undecaprenyl-diphosphate phosphatase [Candidatus Protochlamydia sp. W-9]|uniref:undecaprenyl-diphosphate phosphatase n=1 Tax=Candidatus Protochlamydia sp. W-9 TaxID=1785087 RepID=UPI00096AB24E|nr:undecaprenyl-diphosphate phosphatase [Candidatus Protochlamydia sp. W-9]